MLVWWICIDVCNMFEVKMVNMDWFVNCRLEFSWRIEDKSENCLVWINIYLMYENLLEK